MGRHTACHRATLSGRSFAVAALSSFAPRYEDVLALPEDERLELASEIIASVDGPWR